MYIRIWGKFCTCIRAFKQSSRYSDVFRNLLRTKSNFSWTSNCLLNNIFTYLTQPYTVTRIIHPLLLEATCMRTLVNNLSLCNGVFPYQPFWWLPRSTFLATFRVNLDDIFPCQSLRRLQSQPLSSLPMSTFMASFNLNLYDVFQSHLWCLPISTFMASLNLNLHGVFQSRPSWRLPISTFMAFSHLNLYGVF